MRDANNPEFLADVDRLSKIVNATIGRIEHDPAVVVPVLMRLLCINIVTETMHLPLSEVTTNTLAAVKTGLRDARGKLDTVIAAEGHANDEQRASQTGQADDSRGTSTRLSLIRDGAEPHSEPSGAHGGSPDDGSSHSEDES